MLNFAIPGRDRYTASTAARACANVVGSTGSDRIVAGFAEVTGVVEAPEPVVAELPHAAREIEAIRHPTVSVRLAVHGSSVVAQSIAITELAS